MDELFVPTVAWLAVYGAIRLGYDLGALIERAIIRILCAKG